MGHVQNFGQTKKGSPTERIKFIALENEFSELKVIFQNPVQFLWNFREISFHENYIFKIKITI